MSACVFVFYHADLHSVWDNRLLAKALRTVPRNYTHPLPISRIEDALRGTIYDPYVRKIMHEGVLDRFEEDIDGWLACPSLDDGDDSKARMYPPAEKLQQLPIVAATLATKKGGMKRPPAGLPPTDDNIICPYAWAAPLHQLNCDIIWPPELDEFASTYFPESGEDVHDHDHDHDHEHEDNNVDLTINIEDFNNDNSYLELDTPEYAGRIEKEFLMEQLLAMGGIRLAAILNYLFADADEVGLGALYRS